MSFFELLKKLYFYNKISYLFVRNKKVKAEEYSKDYDRISGVYHNLWVKKMGKYTLEMLNKLDFKKGYSLLDLACGTGFIIETALKKAAPVKIIGVDTSKKMLAVAKSRIKSKKVKFVHGDMLKELNKLADNSFDIVTCGWALAYVNPDKLLRNICRVLKPGGQVAVIVNRKGTIKNINDSFLKLMQKYPAKIKIVNDIRFKLPKDRNHLRSMFKRNNFKWINGWDKEESFSFKNGIEAVKWVKECGAIAGTFQILNIKEFEKPLAEIAEANNKGDKIKVTHKFVVGIGKKC